MGKASHKKKTKNIPDASMKTVGTGPGPAIKSFLYIILIVLAGILIYSNTLNSPFQLDDNYLIGNNPAVKDMHYFLEPSLLKGTPFFDSLKGRYFGYLTFALDYKLHGLNVKGYHIFNIAVHVLNGLLVYFLVLLTFRTPLLKGSILKERAGIIALFSSLIFTSHPVQTEAVTYIFQRLASLMTTFYLLSLVCYIKYGILKTEHGAETGNKSVLASASAPAVGGLWLLSSVLFAVLAMKTKENAFTLPFIITLYEFSFFNGQVKSRIVRLVPVLLTLLIIPLSITGTDKPANDIVREIVSVPRGDDTISRSDYLFTQFRVIVTYVRLLFFPVNQNFDYDYPVFKSFFDPQVLMSFSFLMLLLIYGIYLFHRSHTKDINLRLVSFGIFWFFITLTVESSIVPIPMIICEYRVYLPSVGALLAVTAGTFLLLHRSGNNKYFTAGIASFVVVLTVFSVSAYARNAVWENRIRLWKDVVMKSPQKERGHTNLANAYKAEGLIDEAVSHFETALKLKPDAKAYYNLGVVYLNKGQNEKAVEYYKKALTLDPTYAEAHNNMGAAYKSMGLTDKAFEQYMEALKLKPDYAEAHNNLGDVYSSRGALDKAIDQYQSALKLNPDFAEAHNNIGTIYRSKGMPDKALEYYRTALRLKPDLMEAHYNLGYLFFEKKMMNEARVEFEAVLHIRPDMKYARQMLDNIAMAETKSKKH